MRAEINKGLSMARSDPHASAGICSLNRQLTLYRGHYPAASPRFTAHFLPSSLVLKLLNKNIKSELKQASALPDCSHRAHTQQRDHIFLCAPTPLHPPSCTRACVYTHTCPYTYTHRPHRCVWGEEVFWKQTTWILTASNTSAVWSCTNEPQFLHLCKMGMIIQSTSQASPED